MADRIKQVQVAFGSFSSGTYAPVASSQIDGDFMQLHSSLNQAVWVQVVVRGVAEDIFIPALSSKIVPTSVNGSLQARHDGAAPTSGKLVVEAYVTRNI